MLFRLSTLAATWSALGNNGGQWFGTPLHDRLETTEKSLLSYRIGTVLAGVASDVALGIPRLVHRMALFGNSSGARGDLLGKRSGTNDWHGIEAKGRSPDPLTGGSRYVSPGDFAAAKGQAQALGQDLMWYGIPGGFADHWASTARSATTAPVEVVLDDPSPREPPNGPPKGPDPEADFPQESPEERLLQAYYQVASDIRALAPPSNEAAGDYLAARVPFSTIVVGVHREVLAALDTGELAERDSTIRELDHFESDTGAARTGLVLMASGADASTAEGERSLLA